MKLVAEDHYSWEAPKLLCKHRDSKNFIRVMDSLPSHIVDAIEVQVNTASGELTVLSAYWCEERKVFMIDVED